MNQLLRNINHHILSTKQNYAMCIFVVYLEVNRVLPGWFANMIFISFTVASSSTSLSTSIVILSTLVSLLFVNIVYQRYEIRNN